MSDNIGVEYERKLKTGLRSAFKVMPGIRVVNDGHDPNSPHGHDLGIKIKNITYFFEIKAVPRALLGSGGFNVDKSGKFTPTKKAAEEFDYDAKKLVVETLEKNTLRPLQKVFEFWQKQSPEEINGKVDSLPNAVTESAWNAAIVAGMMKPLNVNITYDASFTRRIYAKRGVSYIQIGGAGLFYLQDNPLDLNIPQLQGEIMIETRLKRSGGKPRKGYDGLICTPNINVSGRLSTKNKQSSQFTMDNPDHVKFLFGKFVTLH